MNSFYFTTVKRSLQLMACVLIATLSLNVGAQQIDIRHFKTGAVLFSHTQPDNSIAKTLHAAIRADINLVNADLRNADLQGSSLVGAKLTASDLRGANLSNANLKGAILIASNLQHATLKNTDLRLATISHCDIANADLTGAKFDLATIETTRFTKARLDNADFTGAKFKQVTFNEASTSGTVGLPKKQAQAGKLDRVRNDPNVRENAPPAYFPNKKIPVQYPRAKPQTHGHDLTKRENADAYFSWLCENEAGEVIYKTVDNVDGIFEMRRRNPHERDARNKDRYYLEDPWGGGGHMADQIGNEYWYLMPNSSALGNVYSSWMKKGSYHRYSPENSYRVLERVATPLDKARYGEAPFVRFTRVWLTSPEFDRDENGNIRMFQKRVYMPKGYRSPVGAGESPNKKIFDEYMRSLGNIVPQVEAVKDIQSRYGFMWRGIERSPHDRDLGIGGGELLVYDLKTNELLGYRRNFVKSNMFEGNTVDWFLAKECKKFDNHFYSQVLKPADPYKDLNIP